MNEKTLLSDGHEQALEFKQSVQDVISRSNELIMQWHQFQDFQEVKTYDDFIELVTDPVALLDRLLVSSVNLKATGPKKLNPGQIALMLNVDYQSWINIIEGKPVETSCRACRKMKIRKGVKAITLPEFWLYSNFVTFEKGRFVAVDAAIKEHVETFKVFISNPKQAEVHKFWNDACRILNELKTKGYLGNEALIGLQTQLQDRIMYSYGDMQMHVNERLLMSEVLKAGS